MIKYRLACKKDAHQLAILHKLSSINQPGGFMYRLGEKFLTRYYQILIDEGECVIIVAADDAGEILGFVAGAADASYRLIALKKYQISLLFSLLPELIRSPSIIKEVLSRRNANKNNNNISSGYVLQSGPHVDFWAWRPDRKGGGSLQLFLKWLSLMRLLGVDKIRGEVDKINQFVLKLHLILGAEIINEFDTPDGRRRLLIEYSLNSKRQN